MSLTDLLPPKVITTEKETITLYPLGVFGKTAYELIELNAGQRYPAHIHHHSSAELLFVQGEGILYLNGRPELYIPGKRVMIGKGVLHGFSAHTQTLFLSLNTPPIFNPKTQAIDITYEGEKK
jgi:quercetin dioxygenase-like cupin family protein